MRAQLKSSYSRTPAESEFQSDFDFASVALAYEGCGYDSLTASEISVVSVIMSQEAEHRPVKRKEMIFCAAQHFIELYRLPVSLLIAPSGISLFAGV